MAKFKCTVTRVDEYEIEIDENRINEAWMSEFRSYMFPFTNYEEHAKHLAQLRARTEGYFYEGYGYVNIDGSMPMPVMLSEENQEWHEPGININIISEDSDIEIECEKLKNE
ncbi:hypothetical protein G8V03_09570 [Clostridium botulinum D/C]|uniref:hypothetical protein n=1 Tax=Clostridium botulinum TaxID=1491 RepID=UPI0004D76871|nr:hypothetical protein [Clostridium botulinum]KEH96867.1 hypothetical protein Z962_05740 [Clostridium botulinum C/D str. BKT12695]MCD3351236.1 hypothetical protein [Clostridium botulinum D/C]MCD3360193.1 hypothetical protein [Clostridium botulinum D/C]MCD3361704.1 hypothetical protein [Clostridium botulinum D/C]MCD3365998.1 hypothetical protein [Clostridium botulinum D/C]